MAKKCTILVTCLIGLISAQTFNPFEIGESFSTTRQVRLFAGYAGWGSGQLEDEMKRNAWVTHPASVDHVFAIPPGQLWRAVMIEMGGVHKLMADAPEDISWN